MFSAHIISFAEGPFLERKGKFLAEANSMGIYRGMEVYNFQSLPESFVAEHGQFMRSNPRGFGYWLWKPAIVLDRLRKMTQEEILVYADVGFTQNPSGRERMLEYMGIAAQSRFGLLSFMHPYVEYHWTKKDLAIRLGVAENLSVMATSQLLGGLMVMVRNNHTISVMEEWLQLSIENNYHYLTDAPSENPNDHRFREHRHDQSIGSLVRKLRGTEVTYAETEMFEDVKVMNSGSWPMLATRSKI